MRKQLVLVLVLMGCSETPAPFVGEPCESDSDCRNGFHCNPFFSMCEADEVDGGTVLPMDDGGNVILPDGNVVPIPDSGMVLPDDPDAGQDGGMIVPDVDAGSDDTWLDFFGGTARSEGITFDSAFTVETWVRFDRDPQVADTILSACDGCFQMDVVNYCPGGGSCAAHVSCAFRDYFGERHRLFVPAGDVRTGWHHLSCTRRSDGRAEMAVDGDVVSSHGSMPLVIPDGSFPMEISLVGSVDNLSINAPMRSGDFVPPSRTAMLSSDRHYYPMNEGIGTLVPDFVSTADFSLISGTVSWGR